MESAGNTTNSVSERIYADIKSAFMTYEKNGNKSTKDESEKIYTDRGQITRKAFSDIQNSIAERTEKEAASEKNNKEPDTYNEQKSMLTQQAENIKKINNTQIQTNPIKVEQKQFSLPKNIDSIKTELRTNGLNKTLSIYDIARKYNISYLNAQKILDELNTDHNGFIKEYKLPENSTISYKV